MSSLPTPDYKDQVNSVSQPSSSKKDISTTYEVDHDDTIHSSTILVEPDHIAEFETTEAIAEAVLITPLAETESKVPPSRKKLLIVVLAVLLLAVAIAVGTWTTTARKSNEPSISLGNSSTTLTVTPVPTLSPAPSDAPSAVPSMSPVSNKPTVGRPVEETQKLIPEVIDKNQRFGAALSMHNGTVVVGAPGPRSSSAQVFVQSEDGSKEWVHEAELIRPDNSRKYGMGQSVAVWFDRVLVADVGKGFRSTYLYERHNGTWPIVADFTSDLTQDDDFFGGALAMGDGFVVVGAKFDSVNGNRSGAVYVFLEDPVTGNWSEGVKLYPSDPEEGMAYGYHAEVDGDFMVIGGSGNDTVPGAAYVYERDDAGQWIEQAKLQSPDNDQYYFGKSVSIENRTIVVGAKASEFGPSLVGVAHVYDWNDEDESWVETAVLRASDNVGNFDEFGESVVISNGRILVGATRSIQNGGENGGGYLFEKVDGEWIETLKFVTTNPIDGHHAGRVGALSDDTAVLGARLHKINGLEKVGAAFVYNIS